MMGTMLIVFDKWDADVGGGVSLHGRSGGSGPPVVLLHGHPRTHTTWYRVAPLLVAAEPHGGVPRPARVRPLVQA